jgi:hypothetical protein
MSIAASGELQVGANTDMTLLQPGQLWQVDRGYVLIVQIGRRLAHYKLFNPRKHRSALIRLITIEALTEYLRVNRAVQVIETEPEATRGGPGTVTTTSA